MPTPNQYRNGLETPPPTNRRFKQFASLTGYGIRANVITPGSIDTPLFRQGIEHAGGSAKRIAQTVPTGRLGEPIDVGRAIRFLLSDEASNITGTNLVVDGGRTSAG